MFIRCILLVFILSESSIYRLFEKLVDVELSKNKIPKLRVTGSIPVRCTNIMRRYKAFMALCLLFYLLSALFHNAIIKIYVIGYIWELGDEDLQLDNGNILRYLRRMENKEY